MDLSSANQIIGAGATPLTIFGGSAVVKAWWDASRASSLWQDAGRTTPATNATSCNTMDDVSGNGNNQVSTGGTARPLVNANGLIFDGVNDMMAATFVLNQPWEMFLVWRPVGTTAVNGTWFDGIGAAQTARIYNDGTTKRSLTAGGGFFSSSEVKVDDAIQQLRVLWNGATGVYRANRGAIDATPGLVAANPGGVTIAQFGGGGSNGQLIFYEMIVINRAASAGERTAMETYFLGKWGA